MAGGACPVPYGDVDTLFLDVGNTLVSIDFPWVAGELGERGIACTPEELERAEAAARPIVSERLLRGSSGENTDGFRFYLATVLECLGGRAADDIGGLVESLAPVLRLPGRSDRLWRRVMPGVPEALRALRDAGLALVVVSNSDGSVERGLTDQGLRGLLDAVFDSQVVGFEKPDPRIFEHALARAGAQPERTLHVGDMYGADVVGARAAGIHAVLLDPHGDWGEVDCDRHADLPGVAREVLASR